MQFELGKCKRKSKFNPDAYDIPQLKELAKSMGIPVSSRDTKKSLCQKIAEKKVPVSNFDPTKCVRKTKKTPDAYSIPQLKNIAASRGVPVSSRNTKTSLCKKLMSTVANDLEEVLKDVTRCGQLRDRFYTYANKNGFSGSLIKSKPSLRKGIGLLYEKNDRVAKTGKGDFIRVYLACVEPTCSKPLAIKMSDQKGALKTEFDINRILYDSSKTSGILRPYKYFVCEDNVNAITIVQYAGKGSLFEVMKSPLAKELKKSDYKRIVRQILNSLVSIQKKYPKFRHNDLHLGNVAIDDKLNAYMFDFELASLPEKGVRGPDLPDYGIFPGNVREYDFHLFLSALHSEVLRKVGLTPETKDLLRFIERNISSNGLRPELYNDKTGQRVIYEFRITRDGQKRFADFIRPVSDIMKDEYLKV